MNNRVGKTAFHPSCLFFLINVFFLLPQQAFSEITAASSFEDLKEVFRKTMEENLDLPPSWPIYRWISDLKRVSGKDYEKSATHNNKLLIKQKTLTCALYEQEILKLIKDTKINDLLTPYHKHDGKKDTILHEIAKTSSYDISGVDSTEAALQEIAQAILDKPLKEPSEVSKLLSLHDNLKDSNGRTPLHYAVEQDNEGLTTLLLAKGFTANVQDNNGDTPLHLLCKRLFHKKEILSALLAEKGIDVNAKNKNEETPLHYAVLSGYVETTELPEHLKALIEKGADVNALDKNGNTPLHNATKRGKVADHIRERAIAYLIEQGADSTIKNKEGKTAFDKVKEREDTKEFTLLKEAYEKKAAEKATALEGSLKITEKTTPLEGSPADKPKPSVNKEGEKGSVTTDGDKTNNSISSSSSRLDNYQQQSSLNPLKVGLVAASLTALVGTLAWFYKKSKKIDQEVMHNQEFAHE